MRLVALLVGLRVVSGKLLRGSLWHAVGHTISRSSAIGRASSKMAVRILTISIACVIHTAVDLSRIIATINVLEALWLNISGLSIFIAILI